MRLLAAPDKMRGTLDAREVAHAIACGAAQASWECVEHPLSDGGEGFAEILGGTPHQLEVSGPLGTLVNATFWMLDGTTAALEMADAAGRALLPHPTGNDPLFATTRGVGELIVAATRAGARTIIVGCGGSATSDGGRGAIDAIEASGGIDEVELLVATDVTTPFLEAAVRFAPQKGASPEQVVALTERLRHDAEHYRAAYGVDVTVLARAGAAGGLAGGLAALGGTLLGGFDFLATRTGLASAVEAADLVVTAEGRLDATTLEGKTIQALLDLIGESRDVLFIAGSAEDEVTTQLLSAHPGRLCVVDLSARFGADCSLHETKALVTEVVADHLVA